MGDVVLRARKVHKRYGGVQALTGVSLTIRAGEVVGLAGDNGAGKSTLVKIIGGVERPDRGVLYLKGEPSYPSTPLTAQRAGVRVVYQDLALCSNVSAVSNVFLGREKVKVSKLGPFAIRDEVGMWKEAREAVTALGLISSEDLNVPVRYLSGGQQQMIAIARAIFQECRLLLLDEPTAALGVVEREHVLETVRSLGDGGRMGVVLVSHNIDELVSVTDRVVVLRHGRVVGRFEAGGLSVPRVVEAIVGGSPLEDDPEDEELVGVVTGQQRGDCAEQD